jgi:hypothetical protein
MYNHNQLHLCVMGKRAMLMVGGKKIIAYKEQYPGAS